MLTPLSYHRQNSWPTSTGRGILWLLTPQELEDVPDGTPLTSINDTVKVKGVGDIDTDTRFGYTAYGLFEDQFMPDLG